MARTEQDADEGHLHLLPEGTSFQQHPYLYRVLLPGQDFLEENGFSTYKDTVKRIKDSGKAVVLSLGESSTSGWDTTVTPLNRERKAQGLAPVSAFFRYRNYTDLLRECVGEQYEVVNAGIPGHTVLTGLRRLQLLRDAFDRDSLKIRHVVIHYGNNDCLWEGNFRDRWHLQPFRRIPWFIERRRRQLFLPKLNEIVLRTSLVDFTRYLKRLVKTTNDMGAQAILIRPEIPLYWRPGRRFVDLDFGQLARQPGGQKALASMDEARRLWESAINLPYSRHKIELLQAAAELDFIIPRIKHHYVAALEQVAAATDTPLVKTPVPRDADEQEYFVDYCHPRTIINNQIATQTAALIRRYEMKPS